MATTVSSNNSEKVSWSDWFSHFIDSSVTSGFPIFFWIRPRFTAAQIPSQAGKVVLVTGGNSGTGYETCKAMYEAGATVYLACRSLERGRKAIEDIKKGGYYGLAGIEYPKKDIKAKKNANVKAGEGRLELMQLDLSDLDSISHFVDEFKSKEKKLDLLFANAGVMSCPEGMHTKQGYTLQFGTNTLGHQRLISLLLPLLLETSKSNPSSLPRIVSTSSTGHTLAPEGGFNPISVVRDADSKSTSEHPIKGKNEEGKWAEYGQSKWGNIAVARYIHWLHGPKEGREKVHVKPERVGEGEIISISLHPGLIATNLGQHMPANRWAIKHAPWLVSSFLKPASVGASNQLWVATLPEAEAKKLSGEYIVPYQRVGVARPDLNSKERVSFLWDWCELQGKRTQ